MDWLDLLAVQGTLKSLLQHHSSKACTAGRFLTSCATREALGISVLRKRNNFDSYCYCYWSLLVWRPPSTFRAALRCYWDIKKFQLETQICALPHHWGWLNKMLHVPEIYTQNSKYGSNESLGNLRCVSICLQNPWDSSKLSSTWENKLLRFLPEFCQHANRLDSNVPALLLNSVVSNSLQPHGL